MNVKGRIWTEPLEDKRGNTIEVGKFVYYNLSGDVAMGTVVRIKKGRVVEDAWATNYKGYPVYDWSLRPVVYIQSDHSWARKESKVPIITRPGDPVGKILVAP